jgi:hypothetical protein
MWHCLLFVGIFKIATVNIVLLLGEKSGVVGLSISVKYCTLKKKSLSMKKIDGKFQFCNKYEVLIKCP